MSKALYPYYERELHFLRQMAREFAEKYPATAGRLMLEPTHSTDPHVERMVEAFALLAGRVHHKLDAEFPELSDALLNILYPHYLAPLPSFAVVQFEPDPLRLTSPDGFTLPAGSRLHTQPVGGLPCRYRTAYPVTLWPVVVRAAEWLPPPFPRDLRPPPHTAAVLRLGLDCAGAARFPALKLDRLRFFLHADPQLVGELYEALFNQALAVEFRDPEQAGRPARLKPDDCLRPVGFGRDDGLLPSPPQALPGYRMLTEFFAFPQKFWFVDLLLSPAARAAAAGRRLEVLVYFSRTEQLLEQGVDATTFRPGCTPVVNLFEQTAEPIRLDGTRYEYPVVPRVSHPQGVEVYSIERVTATYPAAGRVEEFRPFHAIGHGTPADARRTFWYAARRAATAPEDSGTDVVLTLVDLDFEPARPADGILSVTAVCTNRDLPARLREAGERVAFTLEAPAPLARARCLQPPTAPLRPFSRRGVFWRLISHLSLNHLSIGEDPGALEAFREILALYDFTQWEGGRPRSGPARNLIEGVTAIRSRQVVRRLGRLSAGGFCRGLEIEVELDREKYVGTGPFLFAAMLDRFFGLYAAVNSFTQLVARSRGDTEPFKVWPPRAGEVPLL